MRIKHRQETRKGSDIEIILLVTPREAFISLARPHQENCSNEACEAYCIHSSFRPIQSFFPKNRMRYYNSPPHCHAITVHMIFLPSSVTRYHSSRASYHKYIECNLEEPEGVIAISRDVPRRTKNPALTKESTQTESQFFCTRVSRIFRAAIRRLAACMS